MLTLILIQCCKFLFRWWLCYLLISWLFPWDTSAGRNNDSRWTGRTYDPLRVRISTTRAIWSFPSKTLMTLAIGHIIGDVLSSFKKTMSPIYRFSCSAVHLVRCWRVVRYSEDHRFQKKFIACWRCWNLLMSVRSALSGGSESGTVSSGRPIRKCAGVSVWKSFGSLDGEVNGREFIMASICVSNVVNSSRGRVVLPVVFTKCRLKDLTAASQRPPKWGERGGIVSHWILW